MLFVESVVVPIVFAFLAGALEAIIHMTRGVADGDRKFRVWLRQQGLISAMLHQSITSMRPLFVRQQVVDIDVMFSLGAERFVPVAYHLIIAALVLEAVSMLDRRADLFLMGIVFVVQLSMVFTIIVLTILLGVWQPWVRGKGLFACIALLLGTSVLMLAFVPIQHVAQ